jgi:hypothetical protein
MKKIAIATLMVLASTAFAASVTLEGQDQQGERGAVGSTNYALSVKDSINNTFAADIGLTNYQQDNTKALSTRLETGLTASVPMGPVGLYARTSIGEKYNNTKNFAYYSIEPGVTVTLGKVGFKLGYRYRDAVNEINLDKTRTGRVGVSYVLSNKDTIGVRYDKVTGDSWNHSYNVSYTRSF